MIQQNAKSKLSTPFKAGFSMISYGSNQLVEL